MDIIKRATEICAKKTLTQDELHELNSIFAELSAEFYQKKIEGAKEEANYHLQRSISTTAPREKKEQFEKKYWKITATKTAEIGKKIAEERHGQYRVLTDTATAIRSIITLIDKRIMLHFSEQKFYPQSDTPDEKI